MKDDVRANQAKTNREESIILADIGGSENLSCTT